MNLSRAWFFWLAATVLGVVTIGCHESNGAQPNSVDVTRSAAASPASVVPPASADKTPPPADMQPAASATAPDAGQLPASPPAIPAPETGPALFDEHGKPLAQTDQRPTVDSSGFETRIATVARAIQSGEVEPALSAFFPLVAYQQVKDVAKPERDYRFRLLANFKRDLLEYHRALGSDAAASKFEGITVSDKDVKWMAPGSEGNKVGYFRVLRSRLRFTLPTGRSREFELTSLISWRGEWYVVHLHGFK